MVEKVNPNQVQPIEKPKVQETSPSGQFGRVLDQALASTERVAGSQPLSGPGPVGPIPGLLATQLPEHLRQVSQTTDLLDSLSRMLADHESTSKQIAPLISDLNSQAEKLIALANSLPDGDKARIIMEQTAILTKVQVTKYEVGEFV